MVKSKNGANTIAFNKKARHNYTLSEKFESGMSLLGWEVKSIRAGKIDISDCYVFIKNSEAYLLGSEITPLLQSSSHVECDPRRERKLLLNEKELTKLSGLVERDGLSLIATKIYWKGCWVKLEFCVGRGKKHHDKREDEKTRDWERKKEHILKNNNR